MMEVFLRRLKIVQKCCCCSLEAGTRFILWIWTCWASIAIFSLLIAWSSVSSDLDYKLRQKFLNNQRETYSSPYQQVDASDLRDQVYLKMYFLCLVCYIFLFQLCPHISALYSIRKKKPSYLEPYIFVKITEFLFCSASIIIIVLSFFIVNANLLILGGYSGTLSAIMLWLGFFTIIYSVINYYCTNVVYSYYVKMKEEKKSNQMAAELTAILPAGNSFLQNPSVSLPMNNQPSVYNDMSSLPIKNYQANNVVPSAPVENQPFMQHKDYNLKLN